MAPTSPSAPAEVNADAADANPLSASSSSSSPPSSAPAAASNGVPKKSKGKLFQCTGYPGCSMIFTRSEHLARHIRKHTGERPFQCDFCFKKFSRLDNLRQHKQTVHQFQMSNGANNTIASSHLAAENGSSSTPVTDMHPFNAEEQRQMQLHAHGHPHGHPHLHHIHSMKNQKYNSKSTLKRKNSKLQYSSLPHPGEYHDPNYQNYQSYQDSALQNPKTPSADAGNHHSNSNIHSLVSPPNSVSPHVNQLTNSMLPPPRRNSLLQSRGYSEFRPSSSNKPVPIIIENADSSTPGSSSSSSVSSAKNNTNFSGKILNHHPRVSNAIITPNTGTGSVMDISPVPIPPLQQYPLQQALQNPLTRHLSQQNPSLSMYPPSSNFSSPAVSPSMVGFADSPSPYVLNFGPQHPQHPQHPHNQPPSSTSSALGQQHLPPQPLSPQFYMTNSASVTPTTNQFEFQNNPYLSPLYYQRLSHGIQPGIQSHMHFQYNAPPPPQHQMASHPLHHQQQQQQQQQQQPYGSKLHGIGQVNPIYQAAPTPNSQVNTPTAYHMPVPEPRKGSQLINGLVRREEFKEREAQSASSAETSNTRGIQNTETNKQTSRIPSPSISKTSFDHVKNNDVADTKGITKSSLSSSGSRDSRDSTPSNDRSQRSRGEASSLSTADSRISALGFSSETKKPCIANLLNG